MPSLIMDKLSAIATLMPLTLVDNYRVVNLIPNAQVDHPFDGSTALSGHWRVFGVWWNNHSPL